MRRLIRCRFLALLLTLGLLFGAGIAGCTDKDRAMGPSPEPSANIIKYRFQQDTAFKVAAGMTTAYVYAFDEDWNLLDGASLLQSDIASMSVDGDYIVAEASVPEGAAMLAYFFTNGIDDESEDFDSEVYVIALQEDTDVYTMADGDYLEQPVLTIYADADHQTEQSEFTVGDELYPTATEATRGGLEVPVAVLEPLDEAVVAYTAATETSAAKYEAKAEGTTYFALSVANCFSINSRNYAVVKAAEPGPEPTPEPSPTVSPEPTPEPDAAAAWILPEGYELKDGLIYDGEGQQVSDPAEIETDLELLPGASDAGMAVEAVDGKDGSTTYKKLTAEITPSVDSETAAHFSVEAQNGAVTVSVSKDAETEETAAINFAAEGYEFQNSLNVTVASAAMRHITVKLHLIDSSPAPTSTPVYLALQPAAQASPTPSPSASVLYKAAALDSQGELLEGAQLAEEDPDKWELDAEGYISVEADIPEQTKNVIVLGTQDIHEGASFSEVSKGQSIVMPMFGMTVGEEDTYVVSAQELEKNLFFTNNSQPLTTSVRRGGASAAVMLALKGKFGFYADADLTVPVTSSSNVYVGDKVYFCPEAENDLGIKIRCGDPISLDADMFDCADGVLTAKTPGNAYFEFDWYGFTGLFSPMPSFTVRTRTAQS